MTHALTPPKFWHLDAETREKADRDKLEKDCYTIVPASSKEVEKVKSIYAYCPRPGFKIESVHGIEAPDLEAEFSLRVKKLQKTDSVSSSSGELPAPLERRLRIHTLFEKMVEPYKDAAFPNVKFCTTWHGTTEAALHGICTLGYTPTSSDRVDAGYFGAGVYSTFEADYASKYGDQTTLLLNWIGVSSLFPVIDCDDLHGKTLKDGFDAHFVQVSYYKRHPTDQPNYYACRQDQEPSYTELAVRESSPCLPRYKVKLQPLFASSNELIKRENLNNLIEQKFKTHQKIVVHGFPRMGKSTLVDSYVETHAGHYHFIWKIDCETPEKKRQSYQELAGYLKTPQEIMDATVLDIKEIHKRLEDSKKSKPYLLIYEHLKEQISLPEGIKILVVTRDKHIFKDKLIAEYIEVPLFTLEEGVQLVKNRIPKLKSSLEQIQQFVLRFGCYPSILDLAITYILKNRDITLEAYLGKPTKQEIDYISPRLSSSKEHQVYFQKLSQYEGIEPLRHSYLNSIAKPFSHIIKQLGKVSNPSGQRPVFFQSLLQITENSPQIGTGGFPVEIKSPFFDEPRYLQSKVIDAILEGNNIKKSYPGSAHNVTSFRDLHFKQKPSQWLMEYAIHSLATRVIDSDTNFLTPESVLVRFEIPGKKPYPVSISQTIQGETLKEATSTTFELEQWSWMILFALLTRPGDGRPSNYIVDYLGKIFCVDNEDSFAQLFVKNFFGFKKVKFCSALFCLLPQKTHLDSLVLKKFCELDVNAILQPWMDDVICKEKEYFGDENGLGALFSKEERMKLYEEDPDNRFIMTALFRQGTIATLHLQFTRLQHYIKGAIAQNTSLTVLQLLGQLVDIRGDFKADARNGAEVNSAYEYAFAKGSSTENKLQLAIGRSIEKSLTSEQFYEASLERIPTFEEIEKKIYSPASARQELLAIVYAENFHLRVVQGIIALSIDCEQISDENLTAESRQKSILKAALEISRDRPKPTSMTFSNVVALDSASLEPFLHDQVDYLKFESCGQLDYATLEKIAEKCPLLKQLYLNDCQGLTNLAPRPLIRPINFPMLETLHFNNLKSLKIVELTLPSITAINVNRNPLLENFILVTNQFPIVEADASVQFSWKNIPSLEDVYTKPAELGHPIAQFHAGMNFGVIKRWGLINKGKFGLVEKSAEQFNARALFFIVIFSLYDQYVPASKETLNLFKNISDLGHILSKCVLRITEFDAGIPKTIEEDLPFPINSELSCAFEDLLLLLQFFAPNNPNKVLILCLLGEILYLQGQYSKAISYYLKVLLAEKKPESSNPDKAFLNKMDNLLYKFNYSYKFAFARTNEILDLLYPNEREVKHRLMALLDGIPELGELPESESFKSFEFNFLTKSKLHFLKGELDQALTFLNTTLQPSKELNFTHLAFRGDVYRVKGDFELALQDLNNSIKLQPHNPLAFFVRGELHHSMGNFDLALADFTDVIKVARNNATAYAKRGEIHFLMANFDKAEKDIARARKMESANGFIINLDNNCKLITRNAVNDLKILNEIWKTKPKTAHALALRGNYYLLQNNYSLARIDLNASLKLEPTYAFATKKLALCLPK